MHADLVRRGLRKFGVREADLDDLCHEVFMVVYEQRDQLAAVDNVPYWLRAICWRAAAAYRRRAHRRREVLAEPPPDAADERAGATLEEVERLEERARLLQALDLLDDAQRDLVALHDLGDLPVTELARLVGCDRKTLHKRLTLAHRRLAALWRTARPPRGSAASPTPRWALSDAAAPAAGGSLLSDRLQVVEVTPYVHIGVIGNVMLTTWPGVATLESMQRLWSALDDLLETCGGRVTYLATVQAVVRPPPLDARKEIVALLKAFGPICDAYATALEGGMSWIARPIMTGLAVLTQPKFPMRFLTGVEAAAAWLAPYTRGPAGPLSQEALVTAVTHLRDLES